MLIIYDIFAMMFHKFELTFACVVKENSLSLHQFSLIQYFTFSYFLSFELFFPRNLSQFLGRALTDSQFLETPHQSTFFVQTVISSNLTFEIQGHDRRIASKRDFDRMDGPCLPRFRRGPHHPPHQHGHRGRLCRSKSTKSSI